MGYTAENYIDFINTGRRDKISPQALDVIAARFKELQDEIESLQYDLLEMNEIKEQIYFD